MAFTEILDRKVVFTDMANSCTFQDESESFRFGSQNYPLRNRYKQEQELRALDWIALLMCVDQIFDIRPPMFDSAFATSASVDNGISFIINEDCGGVTCYTNLTRNFFKRVKQTLLINSTSLKADASNQV